MYPARFLAPTITRELESEVVLAEEEEESAPVVLTFFVLTYFWTTADFSGFSGDMPVTLIDVI